MTIKDYQAQYESTLIKRETFRRFAPILARIVEFMGNRNPEDIFRKDVVFYRDWRQKSGLKPGTINLEIGVGASFFSWMAEHEYISEAHNPFQKTKKLKDPGRRQALTMEAQKAIRDKAESPIERAVFEFSRMTPLRRSDLVKLRKEDFDLENKVLMIDMKKTGEPITLPIADVDIEYVATLPPGHIFSEALALSNPCQKMTDTFRRLARKAGIRACLHQMRHTFCTEALRNGVDIRTVQSLMGHSSIQTTAKYLTPGDTKTTREFLEKRARALSYRAS